MNKLRIVMLALLTLISILPLVAGNNPHTPALTTQFFSQSVKFSNGLISFICPEGVPSFVVANFTEQLTARDVGSTWVTFDSAAEGFVFRAGTLPMMCDGSTFNILTAGLQIITPADGSTSSRVSSSGNYTIVFPSVAGCCFIVPVVAIETWTVTTIS